MTSTTVSKTKALTLDTVEQAKARTWTLANAAQGAEQATTLAKAAAYIKGARKAIDDADKSKMVAAAYATNVGIRNGMPQKDIAKALGLAESSITMYKRLHLALSKGITPDTDGTTWTMLASGGMATDAEVAKALASKDNDADDIAGVVAKQHAAKKAKGNGGTPSTKQDDQKQTRNGQQDRKAEAGRNNSTRLDAMEVNLAALKDLSLAEVRRLQKFEESLQEVLAAANKRLAEHQQRRAKAAKVLAPKATPEA